jgi:hypothetical protein
LITSGSRYGGTEWAHGRRLPELLPGAGDPLEAVCGFPRKLLRRRPHSVKGNFTAELKRKNQSHYFRDKPRIKVTTFIDVTVFGS